MPTTPILFVFDEASVVCENMTTEELDRLAQSVAGKVIPLTSGISDRPIGVVQNIRVEGRKVIAEVRVGQKEFDVKLLGEVADAPLIVNSDQPAENPSSSIGDSPP